MAKIYSQTGARKTGDSIDASSGPLQVMENQKNTIYLVKYGILQVGHHITITNKQMEFYVVE